MILRIENAWVYIEDTYQVPHILHNNLSYQYIDPRTGTTINKSLVDKEKMRFPRGVLHIAKKCLNDGMIPFEEVDNIDYPAHNNPIPTSIHLRDYQEAASDAFLEGQNNYGIKNAGIIQLGTGGGKCVKKNTVNFTIKGMEYMSEYDHGKIDQAEPCSVMLINRNGNFETTRSFYNDGTHTIINIKTKNGYELGGSEDQMILELKKDGSIDWIKLEDITLKTIVAIQHSQSVFGKTTYLPLELLDELNKDFKVFPEEITEDMATFFGFLTNDIGNIKRKKSWEKIFYDFLEKITDSEDAIYSEDAILNTIYRKVFNCGEDIFPRIIRTAPKNIVAAFLRGMFIKTDEDNQNNNLKIFYNNEIARIVQIALLNFGILSKRNNNYLTVSDTSFILFQKLLDGENISCQSTGQNYYFDKISMIEASAAEIVDWEIPESKSFFGNGFICHNTILAADSIAKINQPAIFFVHTRDLMVQTERVFSEIFGPDMVGVLGGGEETYKNEDGSFKFIIVAMIQSLAYHGKRKDFEVKPEYKLVLESRKTAIFDETHHSGSESWFYVAQSCPAPFRMGLTATPWRADGLGILLEATTGPVINKISSKELVERGWLSKPDIIMYPVDTQLDERFYDKALDEKNNYHRRSKVGIIFNDHRNAIIVAATLKALSQNETVLIIIKEKIHGFFLWKLLGGDTKPQEIVLVNGTFDAATRRSIMEGFRNQKTKVIIATSLYDEGIDLPSVNVVIMGAGGKSDTKMIQRLGRALRLGDRCVFLDAIKNCQLLGNAENPYKCVELGKDLSKYDSKLAAYYAMIEINEVLGNIKHWSSTEYDIVGRRMIEDANAKEVQRMYNSAFSDNLLTGETGIEQIDKLQPIIKKLYSDVHVALENDKIGRFAKLGKQKIILRDSKVYYKKIKPTKDEVKYVKTMTQKATKLLRLCAWIIGVNNSVAISCPYKKVKTTVKYIDFFDACDEVLLDHSTDRLRIYDGEEHNPQQGDIHKDFWDYEFVLNSEGKMIEYDDIMKRYGNFLNVDEDSSSNNNEDEDKIIAVGYDL